MTYARQLNRSYPDGRRRIGRWDAGIPGDQIPANSGGIPAWMYPSLTLPGDAGKQYAYWVVSTTLPFGLPLADDSSGTIPGLPPGNYQAIHQLEQDDNWLTPYFTVTIPVAGTPPAPVVLTQPTPQTVSQGQQASFSFSFSNATAVQAQRRASSSSPWIDIAGATLTSYITPSVGLSDNGAQYRFAATGDGGGPIYTDTVSLAVSSVRPALIDPVLFLDMLNRVMPYVGDCPAQTAEFHLRQAATDWFQRTLTWREDLPEIVTAATQQDYLLVLPEQTVLAKLMRYSFDGRRFEVIDAEVGIALELEQDSLEVSWTVDRATVSINPAPTAGGTSMIFRAALKPATDSSAIPRLLYEQYIDHIVDGALARLFALPRQTYTDLTLADRHKAAYELAIARASLATSKGFRSSGLARINSNRKRFI